MFKTFLAAGLLATSLAFAQSQPFPTKLQPPNLSLNSGIDMRGGPVYRASEVQTATP